jgi:hypothetical protein
VSEWWCAFCGSCDRSDNSRAGGQIATLIGFSGEVTEMDRENIFDIREGNSIRLSLYSYGDGLLFEFSAPSSLQLRRLKACHKSTTCGAI